MNLQDVLVAAWWPALFVYSTIWLWRRLERLNLEVAQAAACARSRHDDLALRVSQIELVDAVERDLQTRSDWGYRSAPQRSVCSHCGQEVRDTAS